MCVARGPGGMATAHANGGRPREEDEGSPMCVCFLAVFFPCFVWWSFSWCSHSVCVCTPQPFVSMPVWCPGLSLSFSLYVCVVYVSVYSRACACILACTCVDFRVNVCVCVGTCVHDGIPVCVYVCLHVWTGVWLRSCLCACICVWVILQIRVPVDGCSSA